jgi:hypothetical protein
LPQLLIRQRVLEAWHPGQPNSVFHFPVRHAGGIVGNGVIGSKQLRDSREHSLGSSGSGLLRQAVAKRAIPLISFGTRGEITGRERCYIARRRFLIDSRAQAAAGQKFLERHGSVGGGDRGGAAAYIQEQTKRHDENAQNESNQKFHVRVSPLAFVSPADVIENLDNTSCGGLLWLSIRTIHGFGKPKR